MIALKPLLYGARDHPTGTPKYLYCSSRANPVGAVPVRVPGTKIFDYQVPTQWAHSSGFTTIPVLEYEYKVQVLPVVAGR